MEKKVSKSLRTFFKSILYDMFSSLVFEHKNAVSRKRQSNASDNNKSLKMSTSNHLFC